MTTAAAPSQDSITEAARELCSLGLFPLPVHPDKRPDAGEGWQNLRIAVDQIGWYFGSGQGLGMLTGVAVDPARAPADVDLDCLEAIAAAKLIAGPATFRVFGHSRAPDSHYLFLLPAGFDTVRYLDPVRIKENRGKPEAERRLNKASIVELRGAGLQTVFPPTLHTEGGPRAWTAKGAFGAPTYAELCTWTAKIAASALLARYSTDEFDEYMALTGILARGGCQEPDATEIVMAVAQVMRPSDRDGRRWSRGVAHDSYTRVRADKKSLGFPKYAEYIGSDRADLIWSAIRGWLKLSGGLGFEHPPNSRSHAYFMSGVEPNTPAPAVEVMPTADLTLRDMTESVLEGRLGEICAKWLLRDGLPIAYAYPALITVAGALVPAVHDEVRTNLFTALCGPVHSGKSVAIDRSLNVLGVVEPIRQNVESGSGEGMTEMFCDAAGDARLFCPDELGHLLEKAQLDHASFPYIFNRCFYATRFELTVSGRKRLPFDCRLSLLAGLPDDKFSLFGSATTGGLYDRTLFGLCPSPNEFWFRPFEGFAEEVEPTSVKMANDIWELMREWRQTPGANGRVAEICLRVAKICAAFNRRPFLHAGDSELVAARALFDEQTAVRCVLKANPGENSDAKCAFAIRSALERFAPDGQWIRQRDLYRRIHGYRYGPGCFNRAILNLKYNGEIERLDQVSSGGPNWILRIRL